MSCQILTDEQGRSPISVLYCNTSDVAFGPVMYDTDREAALEFIRSLPRDPRLIDDADLHNDWYKWQEAHDEL